MAGIPDDAGEEVEPAALPPLRKELLSSNPFGDFVLTSGRPGPTILIVGDSFTAGDLPAYVAQHAGKVVWLDHRHCAFDWKAIGTFRPDEVWWMTNERFLLCDPGARPLGFPG